MDFLEAAHLSIYFFQPDNLYLLTWVFRLFTFNVTVDSYAFFLQALFLHPCIILWLNVSANSICWNLVSVSSSKVLYCDPFLHDLWPRKASKQITGVITGLTSCISILWESTVLCCLLSNVPKLFFLHFVQFFCFW